MREPAPSVQPLTKQVVAQADGDSPETAAVPSPEVFVHPSTDGEDSPRTESTDSSDSPYEDADQQLHTELVQLRHAMHTRPTIDQARGILMATFGLSPQAAWSVLVTTSQNTNTKLNRLADDLVATVGGEPLPKAMKEQLSAAVAKANATPPADDPPP